MTHLLSPVFFSLSLFVHTRECYYRGERMLKEGKFLKMHHGIHFFRLGIFRASLIFCMGGKLREEMEGDKRDEIMQIKFLV
jgi:hypothetical protein